MNRFYSVLMALFFICFSSQAQDWKDRIGQSTIETMGNTYSNIGNKIGKYTTREAEGYPNFQLQGGLSRAYGEFARLKWCLGGATGYVLQGGIGKDFLFNMDNSDRTSWHVGMGYYISEQGCFDTTFGLNYAETPVTEGGALNFDLYYTYFFNRGRFCRCYRQYGHDRWPFGIFFGGSLGIGNLKGMDKDKKGKFIWDLQVGITIALSRHHSQEYYDCKREYEDYNTRLIERYSSRNTEVSPAIKPKERVLNDPGEIAEAIDLGLSVKWASWNVGASKPEEYGGYYAWGETEEKTMYDWNSYKHCDGSSESCHIIGKNGEISGTEYDVAHVIWGGDWRMPTLEEVNELQSKCTTEWAKINGIEGRRYTGPNGNSIFLPAAGLNMGTQVVLDMKDWRGACYIYWTSSIIPPSVPYGGGGANAYTLDFDSHGIPFGDSTSRSSGAPIRPVMK